MDGHIRTREQLKDINKNPFRLYFVTGVLLGIFGIAPWLKFIWNESGYPLVWHKLIMIDGFMLSFVVGFLMTAIPRFSNTWFASTREVWFGLALLLANVVALAFSQVGAHHFLVSILCAFLMIFAARRFMKRTDNPPYTFLFVGISLFLWCVSSFLLGLSHVGLFNLGGWSGAWTDVHLQGVLLGLVIGVGGRIIPGILGWQEIVFRQRKQYERPIPFLKVIPKSTIVLATLFYGSYFVQVHAWNMALWIRLAVIVYVAVVMWRIFRLPPKKTRLSIGIWVTTWFFVFSAIIPLAWQQAHSHSAHSYFISGFSLLTLLIATRVTLAHSGGDFTLESKSKMIPAVVVLMLITMSTRISAVWLPDSYLSHLSYASALWLVAVALWTITMLPILFRR